MTKPKNKGKSKDVESDSEPEVETSEASENKPASKPAKKEKKKNKKKDDDWEDDIANEIASMSLEVNKGQKVEAEEEVAAPLKKKEKKKKKKQVDSDEEEEAVAMETSAGRSKPKATFDMLMMDDEDDAKSESEHSEQEEEIKQELTKQQKKKDKKAKGKDKKKTAEEEDVDALLAELEKPKETKKSKKQKKKAKEEEMEADEAKDGEETEVKVTEVEKVEPKVVTIDDLDDDDEDDKKKKKKEKKTKDDGGEAEVGEGEEEDGGTVKSAAQKKKEKKERERLKKLEQKKKQAAKKEKEGVKGDKEETPEPGEAQREDGEKEGEVEEAEEESGKKKKKKKGVKEKEEKPKKSNARIEAMREVLRLQKEEEERHQREEEERIRREEEAIRLAEEKKRLDEEKKQKKKEKEKARKERLKAEGKLLSDKEKQDRARLQQMLAMREAQGLEIPQKDDMKKKRPVYDTKKKKKTQPKPEESSQEQTTPSPEDTPAQTPVSEEAPQPPSPTMETPEAPPEVLEEAADVKDDWAASSDEEEEEEKDSTPEPAKVEVKVQDKPKPKSVPAAAVEEEEDSSEGESDDEDEDDDDDASDDDFDSEEEALMGEERAKMKIKRQHEKCEAARNDENLRAPVVCVLGHVDTGKTKILDKLRRTNVQDGEAGGITQQIGATNVPKQAILDKTSMCKEFQKKELKLPGLLIIDTPGHESFSNLRSRGSSLCDIAILVIDIMHGIEPQTIESINLLKKRKTPFIVALNKIDRLYQWKPNPNSDVVNVIKKQQQMAKQEFDERSQFVVTQLAEQGLNAALFYENKNPKEYISLVPTSAHSGDGMGNLLALICDLCQKWLAKKISFSEELHSTVMEVKAIHGLGTTIDVILVQGRLHEGDQIIIAGTEGPIVTQIRGLLMPQPMRELRVKGQYEHFKEIQAAQGVKIIGKDLEKALAGLPLYVAHDEDEVEYYKHEIATALKEVLNSIKLSERGVFVQASTLGSLEALLEFLRTSKIPYAGINIGPVHKKDIMKASIMLEHDDQWAVILAFDVKVEREAQEMADSLGVHIFTADIIYHLQDKFLKHREDLKKRKQEEFKHIAVFPCKLRILPQFIFNSRDPIVMGVSVEAGILKPGTPICVPSKEFVFLGQVSSIEINNKPVDSARRGQEVCIKIENVPGDTPKLFGRHFDDTDMLMSRISRDSIDAVKNYFRDDMTKQDWGLMVELKKLFQIL
ncbi:eukaryotic translation initiation factor 5B-like [Mya arenaria]|uniref:eukaryotic translation initiation factor 5B-like n=1 Tax=Mya arenaria TaxID=6604 RepID=UPI0022E664BD|nr:eukaryotic translation initiation factor 5B-like [Mya arenaria]